MRHVVDTHEVPHLWMHQTQADARNKQGNFYFDRETIYSYGSHFPIARHVTNAKGKRAILLTTRTHSNTTAGHINAVRSAISDESTVFRVPFIKRTLSDEISAKDNWKSYLARMEEAASKAKKARVNRDGYLARFADLIAEANAYAAYFGLGRKYRIDASKDAAELVAEFNAKREKIEKAEKAKKAKAQREYEKKLAIQIEQWKRGEINGVCRIDRIFLRIEGEEIATSHGARFPLAHGIRAFKLIAACRSSEKPWERNGHTIHLGHYAVDRIEPDGTVKAGCHRVEWSEIERIARLAGVVK